MNLDNMYINDGFGYPHIGFGCNKDKPIITIGGKTYAFNGINFNGSAIHFGIYEHWGYGAPMCTCGHNMYFYKFPKRDNPTPLKWSIDEDYMDGFKDEDTFRMLNDIANEVLAKFHTELERIDAKYGTKYSSIKL